MIQTLQLCENGTSLQLCEDGTSLMRCADDCADCDETYTATVDSGGSPGGVHCAEAYGIPVTIARTSGCAWSGFAISGDYRIEVSVWKDPVLGWIKEWWVKDAVTLAPWCSGRCYKASSVCPPGAFSGGNSAGTVA